MQYTPYIYTVQKRQSVDFLEPIMSVTHRKSVTEELLEVASSAIQRLRKFTDDVLEGAVTDTDSQDETDEVELDPTSFRRSSDTYRESSNDHHQGKTSTEPSKLQHCGDNDHRPIAIRQPFDNEPDPIPDLIQVESSQS